MSVRMPVLAGTTSRLWFVLVLLTPYAIAADHFDVVSVRPAEMPKPIRRHSPGRIEYEGVELVELITKAFALPKYQVAWPDWVTGVVRDHPAKEKPDHRFFTISATMPYETSAGEFRLMLQNLLVDRFGLVFHRETRQLPQYELSFVKSGPKMNLAKAVPDGPLGSLPDDNEDIVGIKRRNTNQLRFGNDQMVVKGDYTVAGIAEFFSDFLRHPMVDRTGSAEYYNLNFVCGWNPYATPPFERGMTNRATDSEAQLVFSDMEKQLGLKVTLRPVPTEVLVIDRLSHEATEN